MGLSGGQPAHVGPDGGVDVPLGRAWRPLLTPEDVEASSKPESKTKAAERQGEVVSTTGTSFVVDVNAWIFGSATREAASRAAAEALGSEDPLAFMGKSLNALLEIGSLADALGKECVFVLDNPDECVLLFVPYFCNSQLNIFSFRSVCCRVEEPKAATSEERLRRVKRYVNDARKDAAALAREPKPTTVLLLLRLAHFLTRVFADLTPGLFLFLVILSAK